MGDDTRQSVLQSIQAALTPRVDKSKLTNVFSQCDIGEPGEFVEAYRALSKHVAGKKFLQDHLQAVVSLAKPTAAMRVLCRALEEQPKAFSSEEQLTALAKLAGHAPFLAKMLISHPLLLTRWSASRAKGVSLEHKDMMARAESLLDFSDVDQARSSFRLFKYSELAEVTSYLVEHPHKTLLGLRYISDLARVIVDQSLICIEELMALEDIPAPVFVDQERAKHKVPVSVVGLGKLGGRELNYSSDIDLIFVYLTDKGASGELSVGEYFDRFVARFVELMSERSEDGFCYRVDLRLRPLGQSGRSALSLSNMESYYQLSGMAWERLTLLRASFIGGDERLTESLTRLVTPFVFRRYMDHAMIREIKRLKDEINATAKAKQNNLKEGIGGIREIEFFVQTLQLVYGGRDEKIRTNQTIPALTSLCQHGYISEDHFDTLRDAYLLFRRVENALQMRDERQTYRLPEQKDVFNWRSLAATCGEKSLFEKGVGQAFADKLQQHRDNVHQVFATLFHQSKPTHVPAAALPKVSGSLQKAIESVAKRLESAETKYKLDGSKLLAELVELAEKTPDPVDAIEFFADFLRKFGHDPAFVKEVITKQATLKFLLGLFGTSRPFSLFFLRHPELMDRLLVYGDFLLSNPRERYADSALTYLANKKDFEQKLDGLRVFKNGEFLRIALNDLYGLYELGRVQDQLSALADASIQSAIALAVQEIGVRNMPLYVIIGLGKLGGMELGYGSDLDLLFVVQDVDEEFVLDSGKKLKGFELMMRLAQKVISILQVPTTMGSLYKLDMRLRPSGNQGALVTTVDGFFDYHNEKSHLWEKQALLKARRVSGDPQLWKRLDRFRIDICRAKRDGKQVTQQILDMRAELEREHAVVDEPAKAIKTDAGGLLDIEFLVQLLQLVHSEKHPAILHANTCQAIVRMRQENILDAESASELARAYVMYRELENRMYLRSGRSESILRERRDHLDALSRTFSMRENAKNYADGLDLFKQTQQTAGKVRTIFDHETRKLLNNNV